MMRRRSQLLTHDEITSYEPAAPTTSSCIADEAPANNSSDRGWKDTIPEAIHQRRRRATMTTMTSPPLLLPTQPTTTTFTSSRGWGAGVGRSLPPTHHRRLTVRIILSIASIIILLLSVRDIFYFYTKYNTSNDHTTADDIKELTQTVMRLSQELHHAQLDNERNRHELEIVEKEISDNKIELTWEHEHVASMEESQRIMKDQFQKDRMNIIDTTKVASAIAFKQEKEHDVQLMAEHDENIQLRVALAKSIEELDRVRRKQKQQQQPQDSPRIELVVEAADGSSNTERGVRSSGSNVSNTKSSERLLRGGGDKSTYQPGDSIEIVQTIQLEDGIVKTALRPGECYRRNPPTLSLVQMEGLACQNLCLSYFSYYSFLHLRHCHRYQLRWHIQCSSTRFE